MLPGGLVREELLSRTANAEGPNPTRRAWSGQTRILSAERQSTWALPTPRLILTSAGNPLVVAVWPGGSFLSHFSSPLRQS
jgi:hypothetical protein